MLGIGVEGVFARRRGQRCADERVRCTGKRDVVVVA
jgi:hypothetical protein